MYVLNITGVLEINFLNVFSSRLNLLSILNNTLGVHYIV